LLTKRETVLGIVFMKGKRVVITGGAGFIGSSLASELCDENEVVIVDDCSTGSFENVRGLVESRHMSFFYESITNLEALSRAFAGVDYVLHQAAIPSVPRSIKLPMKTNEVGITGTLTVLMAARHCGVKKVVFASSSSVYGDSEKLPKREGEEGRPLSPYALTKLAGEHYCRLNRELYGLETVSLRYFNVYGPRQDPKSEYAAVVPRFIARCLAGERMPVYGDGTQTRDFTFVRDVVSANLMAAESCAHGEFNVAGGRRISVMELAGMIAKECGGKGEAQVEHLPARAGEIKDSQADISRAKEAFGWAPEWSLEQGIGETAEWYRERLT
jgi:UDP-glucose 4-epimerase